MDSLLLLIALFPGKILLFLLLMLLWVTTKAWDLLGWVLLWLAGHYKFMFFLSGAMIFIGIISGIVEKRMEKGKEI